MGGWVDGWVILRGQASKLVRDFFLLAFKLIGKKNFLLARACGKKNWTNVTIVDF